MILKIFNRSENCKLNFIALKVYFSPPKPNFYRHSGIHPVRKMGPIHCSTSVLVQSVIALHHLLERLSFLKTPPKSQNNMIRKNDINLDQLKYLRRRKIF